jgi:GNAT superfamily N-acetyltransferase
MELRVTVDPDLLLSWDSQVVQYPETGTPGITYFKGVVDDARYVDCLLWRADDGTLHGILNHYPFDLPPWERAGNFNLFVDPGWLRRGIGMALLTEGDAAWHFNFAQQDYTPNGARLVRKYLRSKQ